MYCTQCGCKIEEGFKFCPRCGCEVGNTFHQDNRTENEKIADEVFEKYPLEEVRGIKVFRQRTGCDLKTARDVMYIRYHGKTPKEIDEERKAEYKQAKMELKESLNIAANAFATKSPKKGVAYETKKLSVGRGLVGYGLAGPAGAVLGGLSSKKRQAVDPETGKKLSKREVKKRLK